MITPSDVYKAFAYDSDHWDKNTIKRFRGKITIECP